MATYFSEFDSTVGTIVADLITKITTSTDWTKISTNTSLTTLNAAASAGASSITLPSGHGLVTGQVIAIDSGSSREWRKITNAFTTSANISGPLLFAHSNGASVYAGSEVLKATTTRGADMILDLTVDDNLLNGLQMGFWRTHTGSVGTDKSARWLYWKNSTTSLTTASQLHVTVSAGKEHIFIMIEGPRSNETGPGSATYGSNKAYVFASDMVPYNSSDTTATIYIGGNPAASASTSIANASMDGSLTRNYAATTAWDPARLGTICFPNAWPGAVSTSTIGQVNLNRQSTIDSKFYLFPYVVCSNGDGPRGRLSSFFNAGFNLTFAGDAVGPAPVGAKVTYNSVLYKLIAVDRGAQSYESWGQFGGAPNNAAAPNTLGANVVAVPCT